MSMSCLALLLVIAPDTVYVGGAIVTMDPSGRTVEAVAVRGGLVEAVGRQVEIRKLAGPSTKVVDLNGRTMLPGFFAAHDHFPGAGHVALHQIDLNSPPMGPMIRIADIVAALKKRAATTPPGQWVVGRGYDDTLLAERRHPTRQDLDGASTEHPIAIIHTSGHLNVANSRALALAKVDRQTPDPPGGVIRKDAKTGEPTGVIEESSIVRRLIPGFTKGEVREAIRWSDAAYLARGVTTTVIAGASRETLAAIKDAQLAGAMHLRVDAMVSGNAAPPPLGSLPQVPDRLRVAAVKFWQDGSLQGYTGHLSHPYQGRADSGYSIRSGQALTELVVAWHRAGYQVAVHGNGDAAIDEVLHAFRVAQGESPRRDTRHRVEHAQTTREDQLDEMKRLGVSPSFFVGHVFYWGDRHRDIFLGPARAARISPLASARKRGLRFSIHDDTPVTPVNPLRLVWDAVNRTTRDGKVLGPDQRISPLQALRAVTSDAAWQAFEETHKGSIEPGKLADFVVLERNPLTVPPRAIRDIAIIETIIGGVSAYRLR